MQTIEHQGRVYDVCPFSYCKSMGVIREGKRLVAGYSHDERKGYHVQLANAPGEARGSRLSECFRSLLPGPEPARS
jgi:hypothetical protein